MIKCEACSGFGGREIDHETPDGYGAVEWLHCDVCDGAGEVEGPPPHTDADAPEWLEAAQDDDPDEDELRAYVDAHRAL